MQQRSWVMKRTNDGLFKMCRHKKCAKKGEYKPVSDFYKSKHESDGYSYSCKDCNKAIRKEKLRNKYKDVNPNPDNLPEDIACNLFMFLPKYYVSKEGAVWNLSPRMPMGQNYKRVYLFKENNGYITCGIAHKDGISRKVGVHRLVALAYIPNTENKAQVNHKNGVRDDNRLENLEWVTHTENINHAKDNGWLNPPMGENHYLAKINAKTVRDIRKSKLSQRKTAKVLGVSRGIVQHVLNDITWKHVI